MEKSKDVYAEGMQEDPWEKELCIPVSVLRASSLRFLKPHLERALAKVEEWSDQEKQKVQTHFRKCRAQLQISLFGESKTRSRVRKIFHRLPDSEVSTLLFPRALWTRAFLCPVSLCLAVADERVRKTSPCSYGSIFQMPCSPLFSLPNPVPRPNFAFPSCSILFVGKQQS